MGADVVKWYSPFCVEKGRVFGLFWLGGLRGDVGFRENIILSDNISLRKKKPL